MKKLVLKNAFALCTSGTLSLRSGTLCRQFGSSARKPPSSLMTEALQVLDGSTSMVNMTDSHGNTVTRHKSAKLDMGLERREKPILDTASQGILEALSEEIMDELNSVLASKSMLHFLRPGASAAQLVEITYVQVNRDYSHVTAFWRSTFVEDFLAFAAQEERQNRATERNEFNAPQQHAQIGATMSANKKPSASTASTKLEKRFIKLLGMRLEKAEPIFRSGLMKAMDFRRVPRVFFRHVSECKTDGQTHPVWKRERNDEYYVDEAEKEKENKYKSKEVVEKQEYSRRPRRMRGGRGDGSKGTVEMDMAQSQYGVENGALLLQRPRTRTGSRAHFTYSVNSAMTGRGARSCVGVNCSKSWSKITKANVTAAAAPSISPIATVVASMAMNAERCYCD